MKQKIVYFYDYKNNLKEPIALISRYNAKFMVYETLENNISMEYFFGSYSSAVKYLLDKGYIIQCPI